MPKKLKQSLLATIPGRLCGVHQLPTKTPDINFVIIRQNPTKGGCTPLKTVTTDHHASYSSTRVLEAEKLSTCVLEAEKLSTRVLEAEKLSTRVLEAEKLSTRVRNAFNDWTFEHECAKMFKLLIAQS